MSITYSYTDVIQLTDGNWNAQPYTTPTYPYLEPSQTVNVDLNLSESIDWTATLDLSVIGDFNAVGEVLEVGISDGTTDQTAVLFDANYANDVWFTGETTGPTNGTANVLIGAQPSQGHVTINGDVGGSATVPFTVEDILDIQNDSAVFVGPRVDVSGDLSGLDLTGSLTIEYNITEYPDSESGVDFAEVAMELTASGDWFGDYAISNVVFYVELDGEIRKIKIDDWSDLEFEFKSTETLDFSEETIEEFAEEAFGSEGWDFVGLTIKAGNNSETDLDVKSHGEGEIIFGDIEDEYGAQNDFDVEVAALDVFHDFLMS